MTLRRWKFSLYLTTCQLAVLTFHLYKGFILLSPAPLPTHTPQLNNNRVPALVTDSLPNCIHSLMTIWLKYYANVSPPVCSFSPNLILIQKREITSMGMTEDAINFYLIFIMAAILTYVWLLFASFVFRPTFSFSSLLHKWNFRTRNQSLYKRVVQGLRKS